LKRPTKRMKRTISDVATTDDAPPTTKKSKTENSQVTTAAAAKEDNGEWTKVEKRKKKKASKNESKAEVCISSSFLFFSCFDFQPVPQYLHSEARKAAVIIFDHCTSCR